MTRRPKSAAALMLTALALAACVPATVKELSTSASPRAAAVPTKVCVAHRGASAYAPEHTIAAYRLALEMRADFVEQDLQLSSDGVLVCLHDTTLNRTTNVAEVFPDRATVKPGSDKKTWLVVDFTLAELKTLDAGSWFDARFAGERIPTFAEAIDLVRADPNGAGIYPELKEPGFYDERGFDMEAIVAAALVEKGLDTPEGQAALPVLIQSFSPVSLHRFRDRVGTTYPLIQLIGRLQASKLLTDEGLDEIATYATGIGPAITLLTSDPTRVKEAHARGLAIHPYTVDWQRVPEPYADTRAWTDYLLYELGVDGVFTNNPDLFPRWDSGAAEAAPQ